MAEQREGEKTLEMRVAELEDKLKGLQITEEEMQAYHKVASLVGGAAGGGGSAAMAAGHAALTPVDCVIAQCIRQCTVVAHCIRQCTIVSQCIRQCTIVSQCVRQCTIISDCINECGGGWGPVGGISGGGFGSLGG
jgi:hypothetical protein